MPRLFVAVWPPDDVAAELRALPRKDQKGVRFVAPENWHITLRFLGESNPDEVAEALDGAALGPARARLGPGVDVLADRAIVVPVAGVDDLAATVTSRTRHLGARPPKRFVGHLTVARLARRAAMPKALGAFLTASFEVEEIVLVQSRLDPAGARYDPIAAWPVGAPAAD